MPFAMCDNNFGGDLHKPDARAKEKRFFAGASGLWGVASKPCRNLASTFIAIQLNG
jgi:hypothetical protein